MFVRVMGCLRQSVGYRRSQHAAWSSVVLHPVRNRSWATSSRPAIANLDGEPQDRARIQPASRPGSVATTRAASSFG